MSTMIDYLNKVCKDEDSVRVANDHTRENYCKDFSKGKDGYCKNYTGPKPHNMSCWEQCKKHSK